MSGFNIRNSVLFNTTSLINNGVGSSWDDAFTGGNQQDITALTNFLDEDGNKKIQQNELDKLLAMDQNKDGNLSSDEVLKSFDQDGDGYFSQKEIEKLEQSKLFSSEVVNEIEDNKFSSISSLLDKFKNKGQNQGQNEEEA